MSEHDRWADAAGAYLLKALDEDERAAYEAHLMQCVDCRDEVDALAPAIDVLPASVEPVSPPPALKDRIMAEVHREAALLAAAGPEADRAAPPAARTPARGHRFGLGRLVPVAIAGALLVGLAIGIARSGDDGRTVTARIDAERAPNARAEVEVRGGTAMLVAHGLPAPPRDRVYQVWLSRPGRAPEPTSALFTPSRDGTATASVPGPLHDVDQMLVTDEPLGGSKVPTRDPLIVAPMS